MIENLESARGMVVVRPSAKGGRFDPTSMALHWITVLLIVGQFTTVWLHEAVGHGTGLGLQLLAMHQTLGGLTWLVALARLVWRRRFAYLPPFPKSMPKLQQWIAKANEYGLLCVAVSAADHRPRRRRVSWPSLHAVRLAGAGAADAGSGHPRPVPAGS